ncbi:hypothetical protein ID864_23540 [Erwinia aphidicola]|nr:hypothetical protein [Erwinia aphidicola]PIJ48663.1 hypothetical protein BOM23_23865 [Erwinia sp. OLMDLW33]
MSGDIDRMSASEWAINIVDDDHVRITDSTIWKILQCLGSVDLPTTDRDYLYENDDFIAWLSELN